MKKFYKVSFEHSAGIYCTNLAHAETIEDVERHYSKYAWQSVKEAQPWDVDEARMKGMPIIEIEHEEPAQDAAEAPETTEETETEEQTTEAQETATEAAEAASEAHTTEEKKEEENTMKPEYKHIYVEEARRQLEARQDRSAWNRAVTEDAIELLDTVNDRCEQVTRQFAETEEGGAAHALTLFKSRNGLMDIMKNGADSWQEYSYGGCGLIYDADIAEHYCTPSELKKVHGGERNPNSRETWLDVQARALRQAAGRAADALITASLKTYTVKEA